MGTKSWRFGDEELIYIKEVLDSGFGSSTTGNMNQRLEAAFAERFGVRYAITHANGTATMHSCLAAAGVGPGDEVIVPALTVISTGSVVLHQNAMPVFADIRPDTFNIDPADVARKITPRTRAIIPVGLYGLPADMDPIMELARQHGLTVIEDNAQCFLGMIGGRIAGTIGHMGSFSFENSKHMTTGDGGIVITDDEALAKRIRKFHGLGYSTIEATDGRVRLRIDDFQNPRFLRHDAFGWNYRLPEVAAAVGLAQLGRLDHYVAKRQAIARLYLEAIARLRLPDPPGAARRLRQLLFHLRHDLRGGGGHRRALGRLPAQVHRAGRRRLLRGLAGGLHGAGDAGDGLLRQRAARCAVRCTRDRPSNGAPGCAPWRRACSRS